MPPDNMPPAAWPPGSTAPSSSTSRSARWTAASVTWCSSRATWPSWRSRACSGVQTETKDEARHVLKVRGDTAVCRVGAAWCSPRDQWSRKKGRLIAEGRLNVVRCRPAGGSLETKFTPLQVPARAADERIDLWLRRLFDAALEAAWRAHTPVWAPHEVVPTAAAHA